MQNKSPDKLNIFIKKQQKFFAAFAEKTAQSQGFTLVEIIVSSAILIIFITSVFAGLTSGSRLWAVSSAQSDLNFSGSNAMARIFNELSQAGKNNIIVNSGNNAIIFQTPVSYSGGSISWGNQIQYSLGGLNGQQLLRTDLVSLDVQVLANNISLLQINQTNFDMIDITITLSKQSVKGDILNAQLSSQVRLRN